jgi:hypothetical protein
MLPRNFLSFFQCMVGMDKNSLQSLKSIQCSHQQVYWVAFWHLVNDDTHLAPPWIEASSLPHKINAAAKLILEGIVKIEDIRRIIQSR